MMDSKKKKWFVCALHKSGHGYLKISKMTGLPLGTVKSICRRAKQATAIKVDTRFFDGTPCYRGHVGKRYVSTGACWHCRQERMKLPGKN